MQPPEPPEPRWSPEPRRPPEPADSSEPPEGPVEAPPWRTEPPPRRRWPLVVLVLALAAAGTAAGTAAWVNYDAGSGWRERAISQQARAEEAEERVAELEDRLARIEALLDRSEQDVALLESRVASLASEKAGAEDSAAMAAETAEDLSALTRFASEVGASLHDCITRNVSLTNDLISAFNADEFDGPAMNSRIDSVNGVCAEAEDSYAELRDRLNALGTS